MVNFVMTGVGGYVAPRHLKAIKDTGNNLIAALDPKDSVGILDSYFPNAKFFTEFERFDRFCEKLRIDGNEKIDYVSICSPNYLHDAHIRFALRNGANVICEKPLVLNPWNLEKLEKLEKETGKKINVILQLRLLPSLIKLKEEVARTDKIYELNMQYVTSRGPWYNVSWKGDLEKSGGIATNIGVHLFDMLIWVFGKPKSFIIESMDSHKVRGKLFLEKANVNWFLSIDRNDVPKELIEKGKATYRHITYDDNKEIEFSEGFTDLHTECYKQAIAGNGFGILDAKPSIDLVSRIRFAEIGKRYEL